MPPQSNSTAFAGTPMAGDTISPQPPKLSKCQRQSRNRRERKLAASKATSSDAPSELTHDDPTPSTTEPVTQPPVDDWLKMTQDQRLKVLQGPLITINIGDISVNHIYRSAAMTLSRKLNAHFTEYPQATQYHFEHDVLEPNAIAILLRDWPQMSSMQLSTHQVPLHSTFERNMTLLRASRILGMEPYTRSIMDNYTKYMAEKIPHYYEISIVEEQVTSNLDPVWTKMVNHLCFLRHNRRIPDPKAFDYFLSKHPKLAGAMASADEFFATRAAERKHGIVAAPASQTKYPIVYDTEDGYQKWIFKPKEAKNTATRNW